MPLTGIIEILSYLNILSFLCFYRNLSFNNMLQNTTKLKGKHFTLIWECVIYDKLALRRPKCLFDFLNVYNIALDVSVFVCSSRQMLWDAYHTVNFRYSLSAYPFYPTSISEIPKFSLIDILIIYMCLYLTRSRAKRGPLDEITPIFFH